MFRPCFVFVPCLALCFLQECPVRAADLEANLSTRDADQSGKLTCQLSSRFVTVFWESLLVGFCWGWLSSCFAGPSWTPKGHPRELSLVFCHVCRVFCLVSWHGQVGRACLERKLAGQVASLRPKLAGLGTKLGSLGAILADLGTKLAGFAGLGIQIGRSWGRIGKSWGQAGRS